MRQPDPSLEEVYVQPGESRLVERPAMLRTVLGSCVGIAWHVPRLGIAALCHPMLPEAPAGQGGPKARRYVDFAIAEMAAMLESRGARRDEVRVKLFGGADVLEVAANSTRPTVGRANSEAAQTALATMGFEIAAARLGGGHGLHLSFNTLTGEVLVRRLPEAARLQKAHGASHA